MSAAGYETVETDVLVVGAGGAGLRGAIAAAEAGARLQVVCKSLLGKAHTVMAEGGVAAATPHAGAYLDITIVGDRGLAHEPRKSLDLR